MPPTLVSRMRAAEELLYEQEMWEEDESGEYPRSEEEMRVLRKLAGCQPTAPVPISNRFFSSEIRQSTAKRLHGNPWSTNTMKFALALLDDAEIPKNVCIALATSNVHLKPEKLSTPSFKDWDPKVHDTIVVTHYLQGYPLGSRLTTVDDSEASMRESEGGGIWYLVICKIKEVEDGVLVVDVDSIESGQKVSATRTDANDAYNKTMNALVAGIGKHAKKLMKGVNEIQHGFKKRVQLGLLLIDEDQQGKHTLGALLNVLHGLPLDVEIMPHEVVGAMLDRVTAKMTKYCAASPGTGGDVVMNTESE